MITQTLDSFVRDCAALVDDPEAKKSYVKLLRCARMGINDIGINVFPKIKTIKETVDSNLTVTLPKNCFKITSVAKWVKVGDQDCCYPIGEKSVCRPELIPGKKFDCGETDAPREVDATSQGSLSFLNYNAGILGLYYYGWYYGEFYGYKRDLFFGYYEHDEAEGRLILAPGMCVQENDVLVIEYETLDEMDPVVPVETQAMLRQRVLQYYWMNANTSKSNMAFSQFKVEVRQFRKMKLEKSPEKIINSIVRNRFRSPR